MVADGAAEIIRLENVSKSFPRVGAVLRGVTLSVRRGETLAVIGQSGVGKSVCLRLMVGLLHADAGRVLLEGRDLAGLGEKELLAVRRRFAMLFQSGALFDSMTVGENVAFGLRALGVKDEARLQEAVEENLRAVGLGKAVFPEMPDKMPAEVSGGQRKRIALARALAVEPEIILYDEPTTGLDPIMSDAIADLILETRESLRGRNVTSVVVTHDMHVALKAADRIVMFHGGEIAGEGGPDYFRALRDREDAAGLSERELMIRQFVRGEAAGPIRAVL